jgi:hypothetical protein
MTYGPCGVVDLTQWITVALHRDGSVKRQRHPSCNRPAGHGGHHREYNAKTAEVKAHWMDVIHPTGCICRRAPDCWSIGFRREPTERIER